MLNYHRVVNRVFFFIIAVLFTLEAIIIVSSNPANSEKQLCAILLMPLMLILFKVIFLGSKYTLVCIFKMFYYVVIFFK